MVSFFDSQVPLFAPDDQIIFILFLLLILPLPLLLPLLSLVNRSRRPDHFHFVLVDFFVRIDVLDGREFSFGCGGEELSSALKRGAKFDETRPEVRVTLV